MRIFWLMKTSISLTCVLCLLTSGCSQDTSATGGRKSSNQIEKVEINTLNPVQENLRAVGTTQE